MCGSCNIIKYELLDLPKIPEYNRGYGYYKFYIDHRKVKDFMSQKGNPMKPLPFPGSVYILGTGDNLSANENNLSFNFINRKVLTSKIRDEFCLYPLEN